MKKAYILLVSSVLGLTSLSAFGAEKPIFARGSSPVNTYKRVIVIPGLYNDKLKEDEGPNARFHAEKKARDEAKKAFKEYCANTKNGVPSNVTAVLARDPSDYSQSTACTTEWENVERTKGTITCTARATGICKVREKDPRVSENTKAPVRLIAIDGQRFLIDESGVAHPVADTSQATTVGAAQ